MLNVLFFSGLVVYLLAMLAQFGAGIFKVEKLRKLSWVVFLVGFALNLAYMVARGVVAGRLPLSNQFEFATAFAWGIALMYVVLHIRLKADWLGVVAMPAVFLVLSYAALQPSDITELMPALKSAWFGLHIGAAVFSYAGFAISACLGVRYLVQKKKGVPVDDTHMLQLDYLGYRTIVLGFLLLTVVILSGCIWAEQAWSTFWSWDPKETWALITWILYAIYLHQRLRKNWQGEKMAWFSIIAIICVLFTFAGVNVLMAGLHSYA